MSQDLHHQAPSQVWADEVAGTEALIERLRTGSPEPDRDLVDVVARALAALVSEVDADVQLASPPAAVRAVLHGTSEEPAGMSPGTQAGRTHGRPQRGRHAIRNTQPRTLRLTTLTGVAAAMVALTAVGNHLIGEGNPLTSVGQVLAGNYQMADPAQLPVDLSGVQRVVQQTKLLLADDQTPRHASLMNQVRAHIQDSQPFQHGDPALRVRGAQPGRCQQEGSGAVRLGVERQRSGPGGPLAGPLGEGRGDQ